MKIIVPMAGTGQRFVAGGYQDPKPLIHVNGRRIIDYVCKMFDAANDEFVFICNDAHLDTTNMREILRSMVSNCKIVSIPNHKKGPVFTIIGMMDMIGDEEEVVVCYCDNPYAWDYAAFKKWVVDRGSDGCILSHTGFHPHRLSSTMMAYMKENGGIVSEIKEKECYTDDPLNEHASTGTYYFKKGRYIKKYFQMLMDEDINYKGEYYVTLVYNLLIRDGLLVHSYLTDYVTVFGTPEEVKNFEAWQVLLSQVKSEKDLLACYNYWKRYNEINIT
jgi:NDP-sugar pyrophosphorylase family protein